MWPVGRANAASAIAESPPPPCARACRSHAAQCFASPFASLVCTSVSISSAQLSRGRAVGRGGCRNEISATAGGLETHVQSGGSFEQRTGCTGGAAGAQQKSERCEGAGWYGGDRSVVFACQSRQWPRRQRWGQRRLRCRCKPGSGGRCDLSNARSLLLVFCCGAVPPVAALGGCVAAAAAAAAISPEQQPVQGQVGQTFDRLAQLEGAQHDKEAQQHKAQEAEREGQLVEDGVRELQQGGRWWWQWVGRGCGASAHARAGCP